MIHSRVFAFVLTEHTEKSSTFSYYCNVREPHDNYFSQGQSYLSCSPAYFPSDKGEVTGLELQDKHRNPVSFPQLCLCFPSISSRDLFGQQACSLAVSRVQKLSSPHQCLFFLGSPQAEQQSVLSMNRGLSLEMSKTALVFVTSPQSRGEKRSEGN